MARQFSWPEVAALEVGDSVVLLARASEVARKVFAYGKRQGKTFLITPPGKGQMSTTVTRITPPLAGQ